MLRLATWDHPSKEAYLRAVELLCDRRSCRYLASVLVTFTKVADAALGMIPRAASAIVVKRTESVIIRPRTSSVDIPASSTITTTVAMATVVVAMAKLGGVRHKPHRGAPL